jgi:uncharacterized protein YkwD
MRYSFLIALCTVLVSCSLKQTRNETPASPELSAVEHEVHELVNRYRVSRRFPPLEFDDTIAHHARIHSQNMADRVVAFGHHGFDRRVQAISGLLSFTGAAENVAYNNREYVDCARFAVEDWLGSPGHRDNIEGDYRLTGVGVAVDSEGVYYFTQIFWR